MPPSLAELIAYCKTRGWTGSYRAVREGSRVRAYIKVENAESNVCHDTRYDALEYLASGMIERLIEKPKTPGTPEYSVVLGKNHERKQAADLLAKPIAIARYDLAELAASASEQGAKVQADNFAMASDLLGSSHPGTMLRALAISVVRYRPALKDRE